MESIHQYPEKVFYSPIEDLMVQHSVLRRALLIYEECIRRLNNDEELNPDLIAETTDVINKVIINLHAPLEHAFIFPRYEKSPKYSKMGQILKEQHEAVTEVEKQILKYSHKGTFDSLQSKCELLSFFKKAIRVFRPHIDREDTEMFPEFRNFVTTQEYYDLGERFYKLEQEKFGGMRNMVDKISEVEKSLDIYDLDSFTPKH